MALLREDVEADSSGSAWEMAGLRRGLSIAMIIASWGAVVIGLAGSLPQLAEFTPARLIALATAVGLVCVGTLLRGRRVGLWLIEGSLSALLVVGLLGDPPPIEALIMATYSLAFFAVFLSSRRWGLVWIAVGVVVMSLVVAQSPARVDVAGVAFPVGAVAVLQLVVAGTWLWWAWQAIIEAAAAHDLRIRTREHDIAGALATQERTRAWRAAITRTHETILNDLRYVLRAPSIDRDRLREQLLTTRDGRASAPAPVNRISGIVDRIRCEFPGTIAVVDEQSPGPILNAEALESILREILRNVARYAHATSVTIRARSEGGLLVIEVIDDGVVPSPEGTPGIGRSVVVGESLVAIGGLIEEHPHRAVVSVPHAEDRRIGSIAVLRLLLSVMLAGSALGGSLQFALLVFGAKPAYALVTVCAAVVTGLAVMVTMRRTTVADGVVFAGALAAAAVPWLLVLLSGPCTNNALALTTINLSADALFAILLWVRSRWLWLAALPTVAGVGALAAGVGSGCVPLTGGILLNSIVVVPLFLLISWLSTRRAILRDREEERLWRRQIAEQAHAEAAVELAASLQDSVDQAWNLLWSIAEGQPLDEGCRRRLRMLDSAIRAAIQVDPRTAGGITKAARTLIDEAVAHDVPVHVRALRGSTDERPLTPEVMGLLEGLMLGDGGQQSSVHVFSDGVEDYLALTTTREAAGEAGLTPGSVLTIDDVLVESELTDQQAGAGAEVTILVRRVIPRAALANSGVE